MAYETELAIDGEGALIPPVSQRPPSLIGRVYDALHTHLDANMGQFDIPGLANNDLVRDIAYSAATGQLDDYTDEGTLHVMQGLQLAYLLMLTHSSLNHVPSISVERLLHQPKDVFLRQTFETFDTLALDNPQLLADYDQWRSLLTTSVSHPKHLFLGFMVGTALVYEHDLERQGSELAAQGDRLTTDTFLGIIATYRSERTDLHLKFDRILSESVGKSTLTDIEQRTRVTGQIAHLLATTVSTHAEQAAAVDAELDRKQQRRPRRRRRR